MTDLVLALVTTNNKKEAETLSHKIVKKKLAACVNIVNGIRSIYEWEGEIHDEQEHLLLIKTPKNNIEALKKFIEENHSFEVPEFIVLEVADALPDYLQWAYDVTAPSTS
jgi:periplasmic divalent cation tolerance protein